MRLAVIGNGIAGVSAARHVRKLDPGARITIISEETLRPYARTALMYVYMGHLTLGHTALYEDRFWEENRIERVQDRVERVAPEAKRLHLRSGEALSYDRLLIASGSRPRAGGWPGEGLKGVQGLYGLPDLEAMERHTRGIRHAVVVGGGLIGIELAEMLHTRGVHVTFLVREQHYHARALPEAEGRLVEGEIRRHGIDLRLGTEVASFVEGGGGRVRAVVTGGGEEVPAEWVGVGIGVAPNVGFLEGSGVEVARGVLVDECLRTNFPDVYAAGDCAQLRTPPPGRAPTEALWYTARLQGATAAFSICDQPRPYDPGPYFNSAKFFTVEWQQYGVVPPVPTPGFESLYWEGGGVPGGGGGASIRIVYEGGGGTARGRGVVGFNLMGVRYRQDVCERWVRERTPLPEVLVNLGAANFDPEFFPQFEAEVVAAYNRKHPDRPVALKQRRGWRRWMSPDPRGLTGRDIPPGRPLP